jgi:hypothetical protein
MPLMLLIIICILQKRLNYWLLYYIYIEASFTVYYNAYNPAFYNVCRGAPIPCYITHIEAPFRAYYNVYTEAYIPAHFTFWLLPNEICSLIEKKQKVYVSIHFNGRHMGLLLLSKFNKHLKLSINFIGFRSIKRHKFFSNRSLIGACRCTERRTCHYVSSHPAFCRKNAQLNQQIIWSFSVTLNYNNC